MIKYLRMNCETSNTDAVLDGELDGFIEEGLRLLETYKYYGKTCLYLLVDKDVHNSVIFVYDTYITYYKSKRRISKSS